MLLVTEVESVEGGVREVLVDDDGACEGEREVLRVATSWDGAGGAEPYVQVLVISRDIQFAQGGPCSSHYVKVSF